MAKYNTRQEMHQVVKNNIKQMTSNDQCEQKDVSNLIPATRSPSKSGDESRFFGKEAVLAPKFGTRGLVMLGSE
jgi:hypothetical protein